MRVTEKLTPVAAAMSALATLACCLPLGVAGADFRVLSPPELATRISDWGARFSRATQPRAEA